MSFAHNMSPVLKFELNTALTLCEAVDTPRSLGVSILLRNAEYDQYVDLECLPSNYVDRQQFADDYLVTVCLQKSQNLPLDRDPEKAAKDSFLESELRCKDWNDTFQNRDFGKKCWGLNPKLYDILHRVRKEFQTVLGPLTRETLETVQAHFRFGPGATTAVKGSGLVSSDKYDVIPHLTGSLIPFARSIMGETWADAHPSMEIVEGSRYSTVNKNAKTKRGINIEPHLNVYGQLGVGKTIRKRLKHWRVDLNTQEWNQFLAQKAFEWGLVTIDLKAASDSIPLLLIWFLSDPKWFELLMTFRSHKVLFENEWLELEKFSSMGNGFTFELETLVFYSVLRAIVDPSDLSLCAVYGDDIICPRQYAKEVVDALKLLGFEVNTQKSFFTGDFFESCGSDYFQGWDVRPFFLRQEEYDTDDHIPYPVKVANRLRLYAQKRNLGFGCDTRFRRAWVDLYRGAPRMWRSFKVPSELGDTGFIVSLREAKPPRLNNEFQGYLARAAKFVPVYKRKRSLGVLLHHLRNDPSPGQFLSSWDAVLAGGDFSFSKGREPRRGYLREFVPNRVPVSDWTGGLEWI